MKTYKVKKRTLSEPGILSGVWFHFTVTHTGVSENSLIKLLTNIK